MYIKKFNEVIDLLVLDAVIDDEGNVNPNIKGNIERKIKNSKKEISEIIGDNGKNYPAGIDKNGKVVAINFDESGNALKLNGIDRIDNLYLGINSYPFYNKKHDYIGILNKTPTGWDNVKIDMEVLRRIRRYSSNFGEKYDNIHKTFESKLLELKRITTRFYERSRTIENIQKVMSGIIILRYINEIKNYFTPSSAGSLFESFIAGLIPTSKVIDDNGVYDIETNDGKRYQVKLFDNLTSSIDIHDGTDYYIICLKYARKIDIYLLNNKKNSRMYYGKYLTDPIAKKTNSRIKSDLKRLSISKIKSIDESNTYTLELLSIDDKINKVQVGLQRSISNIYSNLVTFEQNLETIVFGKDTNNNIIGQDEFNTASQQASNSLDSLQDEFNSLLQILNN
jgi:hypothetical protein